ncbi:MAG: hypothetical protein ACLGI7_10720 [Gammaproteobacteria bacterium]
MFKKSLLAAAIGGTVFLTGCGGGSKSSSPATDPQDDGDDPVVSTRVEGPLDPVQDEISGSALTPLADAAAGTPLEGVVRCADTVVTYDTLDIADTVLVALQATLGDGSQFNPDPEALATSLQSLAADLTELLQALAGDAEACIASSVSLDELTSGENPLADTPLAPIGEQLMPVLAQIVETLGGSGGGGDGDGSDLQLATVAALVNQLSLAFQSGLAQIPADAYEAPVVGGALTTIATALDDANKLVAAAAVYDAAASSARLQMLVDHTVVNLLTEVVPTRMLEEQAGQPGAISGQIESASAQLSQTLGENIGLVLDPVMSQLLADALEPALDPIENEVLPALIGPLMDALAGGGSGGDLSGPLAGTPLEPVVDTVTGVIEGVVGGGTGGGTCLLPLLCSGG